MEKQLGFLVGKFSAQFVTLTWVSVERSQFRIALVRGEQICFLLRAVFYLILAQFGNFELDFS